MTEQSSAVQFHPSCFRCKEVFTEMNLFQDHLIAQNCEVRVLPSDISLDLPLSESLKSPPLTDDPGTPDWFETFKYRCLKCSLGFLTKEGMLAHTKSEEHKKAISSAKVAETPPLTDDPGTPDWFETFKYRCLKCSLGFLTKEGMLAHTKSEEHKKAISSAKVAETPKTPNEDPGTTDVFSNCKYKCLKCSLGFSNKDEMMIHIKSDEHKKAISTPNTSVDLPPTTVVGLEEPIANVNDSGIPDMDSCKFKCLKCSLGFLTKEGILEHLHSKKHEQISPSAQECVASSPRDTCLNSKSLENNIKNNKFKRNARNKKSLNQQNSPTEFLPQSPVPVHEPAERVNFEAMVRRIIREEMANVVRTELANVFSAYCFNQNPVTTSSSDGNNTQRSHHPIISGQQNQQRNMDNNKYPDSRGDVRQ